MKKLTEKPALSDEKKCAVLLVLTIIMGFLLFYTYGGEADRHEGIIRLHVVANSNAAGDQSLKLKVRDEIIGFLEKQDGLETVEETRRFLKDNKSSIEKIAEGVVASEGYSYPAEASLGVRYIPEKTYGDITFPAGSYEALDVTLGEGRGENWWCVLFPPLCLLDEGTDDSDKSDPLTEEERLRLKWKILELLN